MARIAPLNPAAMPFSTPGPEMGSVALTRLVLGGRPVDTLYAEAKSLGFVRQGNDCRHPDGSWLSIDQHGQTYVGFGTARWFNPPQSAFDRPVGDVPAGTAATKVRLAQANKSLHASLLALGFKVAGPSYYAHDDGSWVSVVGRQIACGVNGQRCAPPSGGPRTVESAAALPIQRATDAHLALAVMSAPQCDSASEARKTLRPLGFVERSPGYFEHRDGSWMAVTGWGSRRGVGDTRLQGTTVGGTRTPMLNDIKREIATPAIVKLTAAQIRADHPSLAEAGLTKAGPGVWVDRYRCGVVAVGDRVRFLVMGQWLDAPPKASSLPVAPVSVQAMMAGAILHAVDPTNPATLAQALHALNFGLEREGLFTHSSGVWVAVEPEGVVAGHQLGRFAHWPHPVYFPVRKPVQGDAFKILRHTIAVRPETAQQELTALGFLTVNPSYFVHSDTSWVLLQNDLVFRGVGEAVISAPPQAPKRSQLATYDRVPSYSWDWFRDNTALGNTPLLSDRLAAPGILTRLGYVKTTRNGRDTWKHPACGSWVVMDASGISLGWQKFALGSLPFNNRTSAARA